MNEQLYMHDYKSSRFTSRCWYNLATPEINIQFSIINLYNSISWYTKQRASGSINVSNNITDI